MLEANGYVHVFGSANDHGSAVGRVSPGAVAADLEPTPSGQGYWIVDGAGRVFPFGDAPELGSANAGVFALGERVTSISATGTGAGYWLFTNRGRVQAFGDAPFLGDVSSLPLNGGVGSARSRARAVPGTTWSPPTAASSPSGTPPSSARWAGRA
jgi:hypothetical protein